MSQGTKLLALPKKDPLDQSPYFKPIQSLPDAYLPSWFRLPLDHKIPFKSNPEDPLIFARPRLGRTLFHTFPKKDFDTSPKLDIPLEYNPLHDPHLYRFFRLNSRNYLHLVKLQQLIPFHDGVVCTLTEFNQYRDYLRFITAEKENKRREVDERILAHQILMCRHALEKQKTDKPYEYAKKALLERNKRLFPLLYRNSPKHQKAEGEKDEYLEKYRNKRNFIRHEDAIIREMHQAEAIREFRHITASWKRFQLNQAKVKPLIERWMKYVDFESKVIADLDDARRAYEDKYVQRIELHKRRMEKNWSKYQKGNKFNQKRPDKAKEAFGETKESTTDDITEDEESEPDKEENDKKNP